MIEEIASNRGLLLIEFEGKHWKDAQGAMHTLGSFRSTSRVKSNIFE
jgi:hypothetical protein